MIQKKISPLYQNINDLVRQIPPGFVTTYGRIGQLIGCTARTVGFAMASLQQGSDVPWQRVINSQGRVSPRSDGVGNILQRELLEAEGIVFNFSWGIDLKSHLWSYQDSLSPRQSG